MRPKIAMWSDYGAPRHKHWRAPRRSSRSSIGPKILVAAVVVVAGVIGISGIYPQIIDSEWVQGTSPRSQRVAPSETARSETAPTPRRSGIVAEIPLPPRRAAVTTGEAAAPPAVAPAPAVRAAATAPAPAVPAAAQAASVQAAAVQAAPAQASSPTRVAAAPAPAPLASPPALSEMRPSVAAAEQPAADPDAALADTDAQAKVDPPADPAAAAPAAAARPAYAGRAPVKRQRVVHVERRQRTSGAYAQWGGGFAFPFFGGR
jgi:hypothetical protein